MNYQVILTAWLIIQMVAAIAKQPKLSKLKQEPEAKLMGSLIGITLRYIGMFLCLYLGGFYS